MAVKIRLTRIGTKKRPFYRIVAIDSRLPRKGRHLEILGTYDPKNLSVSQDSAQRTEKGIVNINADRVQHWLSVGAQPSPTVKTILKRAKISATKKTEAA